MKQTLIDCSRLAELLPLYLSGELDKTRAAGCAAHLHACYSCARTVSDSQHIDERLRDAVLAEPVAVAAIQDRAMQRIALDGAPGRGWRLRAGDWRLWSGLAGAALTAAAALFSLVPQKPSSLLAAACNDHRIEIVEHQPRRWRMAPDEVAQLASARGIDPSLAAAVERAGFRFRSAKLCRLDGLVFLHLVYEDQAGEFSLFLRGEGGGEVSGQRSGSVAGKAIYAADLGQQHAAGFTDGALKAVLVTGQSRNEALAVARATAAIL